MSGEDFQSRYATVMDSMLRSAVAETTRLFQTMVDELKKEINAIKQENDELRSKCMDLEETTISTTNTEPPGAEEPPPHGGTPEEPPGPSEAGPMDRRDTAIQCDLVRVGVPLVGCSPLKSKDAQEALEEKKPPKTHGDGQPLSEDGKPNAVYHLRVVKEKPGQQKPFVKRITIELPKRQPSSNQEPAVFQQDQHQNLKVSDAPHLSCERGTQSQASQHSAAITPLPLKEKLEPQSHVIQQMPVTTAASETAAEPSKLDQDVPQKPPRVQQRTKVNLSQSPCRRSGRTAKKVKPWNSPQRRGGNKAQSQSTCVIVELDTDKSPSSARADEIPEKSSRRGRKPKQPRLSAIKRKVESIMEYLNTDEPTAEAGVGIPPVEEIEEEIEECSLLVPASSSGREHTILKPSSSKSKQLPAKLDEVTTSSLNENPSVTETVETPSTEFGKTQSSAPPREGRISYPAHISYPTLQEAMLLVEASNAHREATVGNQLGVQTASALPETQHLPLPFTPNQDDNVPPKTTAPTLTLSTVASVESTLREPSPPQITTCSELPTVTPKKIIVVPRVISSCGPQTISTLSPTAMSTVIATVVSSHKNSLPQAAAGETTLPPPVATVPLKTAVATSRKVLCIAPTNSPIKIIDPRFPKVIVVPLPPSVLKLRHNSAGYSDTVFTVNKATTKTNTSTVNSATTTDSSTVNSATSQTDTKTVNSAISSKTDSSPVNTATTLTKKDTAAVNSATILTIKDTETVNSATTLTIKDTSTVNSATTLTTKDTATVNSATTLTKNDMSTVNSATTSTKKDMSTVNSATSLTTKDTSSVNSATTLTIKDLSKVNSAAMKAPAVSSTAASTKMDTSAVNLAATSAENQQSAVNSAATKTKVSTVNSATTTKMDTSMVNPATTSIETNKSEVNSAPTSMKTTVNLTILTKKDMSTVNSATTLTKKDMSTVNTTTLTKNDTPLVNSAATEASALNPAAASMKTAVNSATTTKTDQSVVNSATTYAKKDTSTVTSATTLTKKDTSTVNSATALTKKDTTAVNSTTLTKKDTPVVNSAATKASAVDLAAASTKTAVNSATALIKKDTSTVNPTAMKASAVDSAASTEKGNSAVNSTATSTKTDVSAVSSATTSTKTDTSVVSSPTSTQTTTAGGKMTDGSTEACSNLKTSTSSAHVQTLVPPSVSAVLQQKRHPVIRLTRLSLPALKKEMSLVLNTPPLITESSSFEKKHSTLMHAGASAPPKVPNIVQEIPAATEKSSQVSPASQQDVDTISLTSAQPTQAQPGVEGPPMQVLDFVSPMVTAAVHEKPADEAVKSALPTSDSLDDDDDDDSPEPCSGWEDSPDSPCAPPEVPSVVGEKSSAIISIDQPGVSTEENDLVSKMLPQSNKTSSSSKDNTSDPHLQMTKTQFLSQMAMLPVDHVKTQACSNDDMDPPAEKGDGKRVDKKTLVNRLRSHRRQLKSQQLLPSHTEPNPEILPEPQLTPVPAKKARLDGENETPTKTSTESSSSICPNVTTCESIPVNPERGEPIEDVLTQQKAKVIPSSFSPTRSSLSQIVAGLKKITNEPSRTPGSTKDGHEKSLDGTGPTIAKRQRLIEDTVSHKKSRKTVNTASEDWLPKAADTPKLSEMEKAKTLDQKDREEGLLKTDDTPKLSEMKKAKTLDQTASEERLPKTADTPKLSKMIKAKTLDQTDSEEMLPKAADTPRLSKMEKVKTLDQTASEESLLQTADTPKLSKMKKAKTLDHTASEKRLPKAADTPKLSKMKKDKTLDQTASEGMLPKAADTPKLSKMKNDKTLDQVENFTQSKSEKEAGYSQSKIDFGSFIRKEVKVVLTRSPVPQNRSSSINPANTEDQLQTPTTSKPYKNTSLNLTTPFILSQSSPRMLLSPSPPPFHLSPSPPPFNLSPSPPPMLFSFNTTPIKTEFLTPTPSSGRASPFPFDIFPSISGTGKSVPFRAPPIVSPLQPLSIFGRRLLKNQCGQCGRMFASPAALESHVGMHKNLSPFTCLHCGKDFQDNRALNRHHKAHRDGKVHKCEQCGKGFVYKFTLTKHIQMVHGRIKPFVCQICNKDFSTKEEVNSHIRVHTGETPYHCHLCEKKFKRTMDLNKHLRWHNGEKRYWCPYCEKGFLDSNNLKIHKYTHTGEKPRACPHCPKKFTQTGHLKKHLRTIHKEENTLAP